MSKISEANKNLLRNIKIIIRGAYGTGNFGDDMLMVSIYYLMRKIFNGERIAFLINFTSNSSYLKKLLPDALFIFPSSYEIECEFFILGGGTQFYSFPYTHTFSLARIRKNIKSPINSLRRFINRFFFKNKISPKNYAALGIGLGPFIKGSLEEIKTKKLLHKMDFISVRDSASLELCRKWRIKNVKLGTDLCFLPEFRKKIVKDVKDPCLLPKRIGVIVRDWPHSEEGQLYFFPLINAVNNMRNMGYNLSYIIFSKTDKIWLNYLVKEKEDFIIWDPEENDIKSFISSLSQFNSFISARYHGAILAAILNKPVICIDIEQKLNLVSRLLGSGNKLWSYPYLPHKLVSLLVNTFDNYEKNVLSLKKRVRNQFALAIKMENEFRKFVEKRKPYIRKR